MSRDHFEEICSTALTLLSTLIVFPLIIIEMTREINLMQLTVMGWQ